MEVSRQVACRAEVLAESAAREPGKPAVPLQCILLGSGEIQQCYLRTILHSFENEFLAVWRQIKVANVEVRRQVGQLLLSASLQVD